MSQIGAGRTASSAAPIPERKATTRGTRGRRTSYFVSNPHAKYKQMTSPTLGQRKACSDRPHRRPVTDLAACVGDRPVRPPARSRRELEGLDREAELIRGRERMAPRHGKTRIGEIGACLLKTAELIREWDLEGSERHVRKEGGGERA